MAPDVPAYDFIGIFTDTLHNLEVAVTPVFQRAVVEKHAGAFGTGKRTDRMAFFHGMCQDGKESRLE